MGPGRPGRVSALDELLYRTADARLDQLAHQLATALPADGRRLSTPARLCGWPWTSGRGAGWTGRVDDPTAVTVMTDAVARFR